MIVNVGLRTDIVHYYSEWLFRRFREGYAYSRNPLFPNKVTHYILTPDKVDAVLFCSKYYAPALPRLHEIKDSYPTLFHYTINGYGLDTEPYIPDLAERLADLKVLSAFVGRQRLYWRYDPILITKIYTADWHAETFQKLAETIAPYVSGCIVNFVEMFIKLQARMPDIIPLSKADKREIMHSIGAIARKYNLPVRICGVGDDYAESGVMRHGCVTLDDIATANGCRFRDVVHTGNRRGCACIVSRDLGWYDTCPSRCRYCNANRENSVLEQIPLHDPTSPLLIGNLLPSDTLLKSPQESFLAGDSRQISLFDL